MKRTTNHRSGFGMIEVMAAAAIMAGAILGLIASITSAGDLQRTTQENTLARAAIQQQVEEILQTAARDVIASWGPLSPASTFDVRGMTCVPGDPIGQVGSIQLFTNETLDRPDLGLPRDLNADGDMDDVDITTAKFYACPVLVTVRWMGTTGDRTMSIPTMWARR